MNRTFHTLLSLLAVVFLIATALTGRRLLTDPGEPRSSPAPAYEILEPEGWVGKELPILEHIDIAEWIKSGNWLVLLYHHDCPGCDEAIPKYEQMARDLAGNEDYLRIGLVSVPPYGQGPVRENSPCVVGKLGEPKEWFLTTPAVALLTDGKVAAAWEGKAPTFDTILQKLAEKGNLTTNRVFSSTNYQHNHHLKKGDEH